MKRKWNKHQSDAYQLEQMRRQSIKMLSSEYYIFLAAFYGNKITDGDTSIKDYAHLTYFDISSELKIRIQMLKGYNDARVRKYYEDEEKRQYELLEKLRRLDSK
jgi:nucleoside-specific outer membrane channel protein Tsx